MFDIQKFGGFLSKLRKNADMTQSELAEKLNVTHQAISRYEKGQCFPDVTVLVLLAEIFGTSLDTLINSGQPTEAESAILEDLALGKQDLNVQHVDDFIGLAPMIKPSVLTKLIENCNQSGIDISSIVELAEYLGDETVCSMIERADFESINGELLQKMLPLLDIKSKTKIFEKILDGELN